MMQALKFTLKNKSLELVKIARPEIKENFKVLVKVAYAGICGTDLHIIEGKFPCNSEGPFSLGHEICGTVAQVGAAVKNVKPGDRVVIDPNKSCKVCDFCRIGKPQLCSDGTFTHSLGMFHNGGWEEYCLVADDQAFVIPKEMSFEHAAVCEPLACVIHTFTNHLNNVYIGQNILINGAGIIGNFFAITLHLKGHRNVTIVDPNVNRLKLIESLDLKYNLTTPETLKKCHDCDKKYRFDLVIDCSGNVQAIERGLDVLNFGGKLCLFGVASPESKVHFSPYKLFEKELQIVGTIINPYSFPKALGLIEALGSRYINYQKLGIEVFKLQDYKAALDKLRSGKIAKAMFKLS